MTDISSEIYGIISKTLLVPETDLGPDVHFRTLPNANSMQILQIILETEKKFDVDIADDITFRIETIGQFEAEIKKLCEKNASAA
jgi:acyl carrier protein